MTDAPLWFYAAGTEQKGPFTPDQMSTLLRAGALTPQTLVWTAGMAAWAPLAETPLGRGAADVPIAPPVPAASVAPAPDFMDAVRSCFSKYATFSGRATRPEYWYFVLFNWLVSVVLAVIDTQILGFDGSPLGGIYSLAVLLPSIAVLVRRLHDADRTGWWALLYLVPVIGWIVLIIFCCLRGTPGRNRFG